MSKTERGMVAAVVRELRAIKRAIGQPDNKKVRQWICEMRRTTLTKAS